MKKVLVTGGSGLVGSAIRHICSGKTYEFIFASSSDVNLLDYDSTYKYFSQINPDAIIHLAANVGGLYKNMAYPVNMLEHNLMINLNVLRVAHKLGISRLIACLSTCIFPDDVSYPIDENVLHAGPPHPSNAPYAHAKRMLEVQTRAYSIQYGYNWVCVIPTNIYGPNDNFSLEDSHVIPSLIHRCWLACETKTNFVVSGTGKPLRQFIYSHDLARCILWVLESYNSLEPIILAPDEESEVSIELIAKLIAQECGYTGKIEFDTTKSDGQYKKTASNRLLRSLCPEFVFTDIQTGIAQTVQWFGKNYPSVRK